MQKVVFITGTGKGIGKALAENFIKHNWLVYGYSRTNKIKHPKFRFIYTDLAKFNSKTIFSFPQITHCSEVLLINNAARLGTIVPLYKKKTVDIIDEYTINTISPTILCNAFLKQFKNIKKTIINISSGAAENSIPSWSTYCSSKAALDMLTKVIAKEKYEKLKIFSISPGVVDTNMQKEIRAAKKEDFPLAEKFSSYFTNNELESTEIVALKIYYILENSDKFDQNIVSIRDINIIK